MKKTFISALTMVALAMLLMISAPLVSAEGNLIRDPNFEGDLEDIDIRDSFDIKIELAEGEGPDGENALLVSERVSVDNSPIFHAPNVVVGKTYNISMWVKLAEDPGENGVLTHIAFSVPSVEAHFVPLPIGEDTDNSYRLKGTDWVKLSVENYTMKAGASTPNNDFGVFLVTWTSNTFPSYYVSNVVVEEVAGSTSSAQTQSEAPSESSETSSTAGTPDDGGNTTLIIIIAIAAVMVLAVVVVIIVKMRKKQ